MPLRERQPCTHVHACMNTYTHILPYVHRHAQHEHGISHTYIIHTYIAHTHKLTHTHAHATHIHYLHTCTHINSPTIAFPSLSYFLFPYSLTHSLTCACTYIHTHRNFKKITHHHPSITLILPLPFLLFYAQSKSREVGNMWGYPVL